MAKSAIRSCTDQVIDAKTETERITAISAAQKKQLDAKMRRILQIRDDHKRERAEARRETERATALQADQLAEANREIKRLRDHNAQIAEANAEKRIADKPPPMKRQKVCLLALEMSVRGGHMMM